jgi:hypothetical protein
MYQLPLSYRPYYLSPKVAFCRQFSCGHLLGTKESTWEKAWTSVHQPTHQLTSLSSFSAFPASSSGCLLGQEGLMEIQASLDYHSPQKA